MVLSLVIIGLLAVMALVAPAARLDPLVQDRTARFQAPSIGHVFGTDEFGRDLFARSMHGARISLLTALVAVSLAALLGVPLGLLGGYWGGSLDVVTMRLLDSLLAIPAILLAMVIVAVLGPGAVSAMLAVSIVSVPAFGRLARASTLVVRERDFVVATRALGAGNGYLMFKTIFPNTASPLLVQAAVTAATAMLLEAALSFLGLGVQPPEPSWGSMLSAGRSYLYQAPWYGLFPGVLITVTVLALNTIADGLQTLVDRAGAGRLGL